MEKEFIPYEEALALKELGFNEECLGVFDKINTHFHINDNRDVDFIGSPAFYLLVPLYQQAFRWFREKYKTMVFKFDITMYSEWYFTIVDFQNNILEHSDVSYLDYKDAELACLRKLIEIVKTES